MSRLPYVTREELDPAGQDAYNRIVKGMNARPGYPGRTTVGGVYALLLNSPELAARVGAVGDYILKDGGIELVHKEIICLAVARAVNCQMEWTLHEPMSRRAGVREAVIQGIKSRDTTGFLPTEKMLTDYAWEVLRDDVKDLTWRLIEDLMGKRGAVNLTILIAFTALICYCMDAFKAGMAPDTPPLLPIP